jgi:hypothetical protein
MQGIEGVEKLFLGGGFAREKMDVIYEEDIVVAVDVSELLHRSVADGGDNVLCKGFSMNVKTR